MTSSPRSASSHFTPNNELRYNSQQFQNNFTIYGDKNDFTLGVSVERYESENRLLPGVAERVRLSLAQRLLHGCE